MARKNQHVIPHPEGWAVRAEGSSRATRVFYTQGEAIDFARDIAINQRAELIVHNRKGGVRVRRNYRNRKKVTYYSYPSYYRYPSLLSSFSNYQSPMVSAAAPPPPEVTVSEAEIPVIEEAPVIAEIPEEISTFSAVLAADNFSNN